MMNHFGTRFLNEDGSWRNLMQQKTQHPIWPVQLLNFKLIGLAQASQVYIENKQLADNKPGFTNNGSKLLLLLEIHLVQKDIFGRQLML